MLPPIFNLRPVFNLHPVFHVPRIFILLLAACNSQIGSGVEDDSPTMPPDTDVLLGREFELMDIPITEPTSSLPTGAQIVDGRLVWIPRLGQEGQHLVQTPEGNIEFRIESIGDALSGGPPSTYEPADVGLIFVHGQGDADACTAPGYLQAYWGDTPTIIAKPTTPVTQACYDGRQGTLASAPQVAEQIRNAPCGRSGQCLVITHSMGGLVLEHILSRAATDPTSHPDYVAAREKTLYVVSLTSSAGGSVAADMMSNPEEYSLGTQAIALIADLIGYNNLSTQETQIAFATQQLAPVDVDPLVPIFMVPGYSPEVLDDGLDVLDWVLGLFDDIGPDMFFGVIDAAFLDLIADFSSRSDGVVAFRSSCGTRSVSELDGPGHSAPLEAHLRYCFESEKKPNHFLWFMTNLEHRLAKQPQPECTGTNTSPCHALVPSGGSFVREPVLDGQSAIEIMSSRLIR